MYRRLGCCWGGDDRHHRSLGAFRILRPALRSPCQALASSAVNPTSLRASASRLPVHFIRFERSGESSEVSSSPEFESGYRDKGSISSSSIVHLKLRTPGSYLLTPTGSRTPIAGTVRPTTAAICRTCSISVSN